jgi:hypothetical protein
MSKLRDPSVVLVLMWKRKHCERLEGLMRWIFNCTEIVFLVSESL